MYKLILGAAIFSVSLLANAQDASVSASTTKPEAATTEEVNITADKSDVAEAKAVKPNCITQTGSRIKRKNKNGCNGLPGSSYSREDLDRTGALNMGEALQRLDTTVGSH